MAAEMERNQSTKGMAIIMEKINKWWLQTLDAAG